MDVKEPLILHIETSTDICSVALSRGKDLQSLVESGQERSHATQLNSFIKEALSQAGAAMKDLQAVAVSKGPGSYTGLRIGVSTAKGIAYALQIPLLASLTLLNMASGIRSHPLVRKLISEKETAILLCPLLDARRMEVYSAFYTPALVSFREVSADIIEPAS